MSIPKIIHYCWFGGNPKSEKINRCMESWRKHLPDYEIIEWNESNCDIDGSKFASSAYKAKKWAFVADYFRFKALYDHGGIYLDTDMLLHKPLDDFLQYDAFFAMECFEWVSGGVVGAITSCEVIQQILNQYLDILYNANDGTICHKITKVLIEDYSYMQTGDTQILENNVAVFSPNILIINVDDGKNYCEHLYDEKVSWLEDKNQLAEGETWKYTVLQRYFYNLYRKTEEKGKDTRLARHMLAHDTKKMLMRYGAKRMIWQIFKERFYDVTPSMVKRLYFKYKMKDQRS